MKKISFLLSVIILLANSFFVSAVEYKKVYLWIDKGIYQKFNYELFVNSRRVGSFYGKDMVELELLNDKNYFIEILSGGRLTASYQLNESDKDNIYLVQKMTGKGMIAKFEIINVEETNGGLYVINSSNYERKLKFFPEGSDGYNSSKKGAGQGSGFLIQSNGYIVTNHHVVDGAKKIKVRGINSDFTTEYQADVVAKDINNDVVILQLKNKTLQFPKTPWGIKTATSNTGEEVFILGYPLSQVMGEEIKLTTGVISSKTGFEGSIASYQISAPAQPGNSGGPMFDKNGNLLGVINAKFKGAENASYAIKSFYLQPLLSSLSVDESQVFSQPNTLSGKSLSEIVAEVSKFIYIIETE
jgi:S1-C subfamily serine protease